jgi:hypothetical protein
LVRVLCIPHRADQHSCTESALHFSLRDLFAARSTIQCSSVPREERTNDRRIIVVSASSSEHFSSRWVHTRCGTALLPLCRSAGRTARHLHQLFQMEFSLPFFFADAHTDTSPRRQTQKICFQWPHKRDRRGRVTS